MRRMVKHLTINVAEPEGCDRYVEHWLKENPHLELVDCELARGVENYQTAIKITAQPRLEQMVCNIAKKGTDFLKESVEHTALANEVVNNFGNDGWNLESTVTAVTSSWVDHDQILLWGIISTLTFAREIKPQK